MYKYITIIFLLISSVFSGTDGTLRGKIIDSDGSALIGTQVYIPEIEKGAIAENIFNLINVPSNTVLNCSTIPAETNPESVTSKQFFRPKFSNLSGNSAIEFSPKRTVVGKLYWII